MQTQKVIDLILTDDEVERRRLEKQLEVRQEDMVDDYIHMFEEAKVPIWPHPGPGTMEERREALRTFLRNRMHSRA